VGWEEKRIYIEITSFSLARELARSLALTYLRMDALASSVYSVDPPTREVVQVLERIPGQVAERALHYIACHHWPTCKLTPSRLQLLVTSSKPPDLAWAMYAPQVHADPVLWETVVTRLARGRQFGSLAMTMHIVPQHRGVTAIYRAELLEAMQDTDDDRRLASALALCAAPDPPVGIPAALITGLLVQRRCIYAALQASRIVAVDTELAQVLLRCPEASESTFRPLLQQTAFREAVRALPLEQVLRLPTLCYAAADLATLPKHALLRLVDAYSGVPGVVRGQHHHWNRMGMLHNMRQRAPGGSRDWTQSPLATLYYMDHTGRFPRGPLARHRLLQVQRQHRDASDILCMDIAGHLLQLAMHARLGANTACRGGAWQRLPGALPTDILDLIVAFV